MYNNNNNYNHNINNNFIIILFSHSFLSTLHFSFPPHHTTTNPLLFHKPYAHTYTDIYIYIIFLYTLPLYTSSQKQTHSTTPCLYITSYPTHQVTTTVLSSSFSF
eukprot:UN04260